MTYLNHSLKQYLNALAAKLPAPGGGSVSALAGAGGAALLSMVLNFTVDKKGYENFRDEAKELFKNTEEIRAQLSSLVEEDVLAYEGLDRIFKMPKESEAEKKKRGEALEAGLKKAETIPEKICCLSLNAARLCPVILERGNRNLASDVGVAMALFMAAFKGGRLNCEINLKSIKDAEFCERARRKLDSFEKELLGIKTEIEENLKKKMG